MHVLVEKGSGRSLISSGKNCDVVCDADASTQHRVLLVTTN
jgi:hypothetical protein